MKKRELLRMLEPIDDDTVVLFATCEGLFMFNGSYEVTKEGAVALSGSYVGLE